VATTAGNGDICGTIFVDGFSPFINVDVAGDEVDVCIGGVGFVGALPFFFSIT
jgi:hypothetical protein